METGFDWMTRHGYGAIFLLLMLGIVGLPVPDETLLVFAGYLSFKGTLQLEPALATAFAGSACGISVSYALGRFAGLPALLKFGPLIHVRPEHLEHAHRWVERWGKYSLLLAYFIPGYRHLAAFAMGASLLKPVVFVVFAYSGALIWSGSFIALGYVAGEEWQQFIPLLHRAFHTAALLGAVALAIVVPVLFFRRGRK
ncbi:MAG TPA: DedA family protein [Nitrospira sp.]|nr:DedA family protein [Nitrospira sp.]